MAICSSVSATARSENASTAETWGATLGSMTTASTMAMMTRTRWGTVGSPKIGAKDSSAMVRTNGHHSGCSHCSRYG